MKHRSKILKSNLLGQGIFREVKFLSLPISSTLFLSWVTIIFKIKMLGYSRIKKIKFVGVHVCIFLSLFLRQLYVLHLLSTLLYLLNIFASHSMAVYGDIPHCFLQRHIAASCRCTILHSSQWPTEGHLGCAPFFAITNGIGILKQTFQ